MVKSMNFALLGDHSIAGNLGKKGTETDLTLYDKKESDVIRTWVVPNGFPEKIQPLFQAINLSEFAVLHITSMDKFAGEQIVALDMLGKKIGILSHSYDVDENLLNSMIRGTVVENYAIAKPDMIRDAITKIEPISINGKTKIVIDHCFDVKGVGTVVLGKVISGSIKQYDNLKLLPTGIQVMVKSIQMHDVPVEQADCPARVGLSLKGVKPEDVGRGDILCEDDSVKITDMLELDFHKTKYYKGDVTEGQMCLTCVGLKIMAGKFTSISPLKIKLDKPVACYNEIGIVLKPESPGIRILGSGKIL
ncbi:MAG: EF-Tu/IF-2/RF-3 family GTPase [Thaumarchaeota archaeon]|nr:EF-Tu/IF-2/RF-3 family GTPase [Nitrososphaerota archaeon]